METKNNEHDLNRELLGDVYSIVEGFISLTLDYNDFKQYVLKTGKIDRAIQVIDWRDGKIEILNGSIMNLEKNIMISAKSKINRGDNFGFENIQAIFDPLKKNTIGLMDGMHDKFVEFQDGDQFTIEYK